MNIADVNLFEFEKKTKEQLEREWQEFIKEQKRLVDELFSQVKNANSGN